MEEYSSSCSCSKSLYLLDVDRLYETNPRRRSSFSSSSSSSSSSSPPSQIGQLAVNFKFTLESSFHDWILRPPCVIQKFLRHVNLPKEKKSISVDCRQLFNDPGKARDVIAGEFKDWPLTSNERRHLAEIVLSIAWETVEPMYPSCINGVNFNFRVEEIHRHAYGEPPEKTSALLESGDYSPVRPELLPCWLRT